MKKLFFLLLTISFIGLSVWLTSGVNAQGVGINPSGNNPDPSAMFDVSSTTKGQLMPRMTTAQRDAITFPAEGLQIFNTTTKCFEFYINANWLTLSCGCNLPAAAGTISGTATVCQGQTGVNYSVASIANATGYVWVLPSGANIVSGANTNSITVNYSSSASSGNITVYGSRSCGNGEVSANYPITVQNLIPLNPPTSYNGRLVFSYTGANQTYTVSSSSCATKVFVKMWGAGGGAGASPSGGSGAFVSGYLAVTPGSNLTVIVGGGGIHETGTTSVAGGFGGGGASGSSSGATYKSGSGGGRSAVQITSGTDAATAGAGGGAGSRDNQTIPYGGGGGATTGADGGSNASGGGAQGHGGTTTSGGAASSGGNTNSVAGSSLTGSAGGNDVYGSGYFGGSGGSGNTLTTNPIGGGGGGSSYTSNLTSVTNIAGNYGNDNTAEPAPNNTDVDYVSGVGVGAAASANGGNGLVVIYW